MLAEPLCNPSVEEKRGYEQLRPKSAGSTSKLTKRDFAECCKFRWTVLCEDGEDLSEPCVGLLRVLLGSMGMDIRWTSRGTFYVAAMCSVLILCTCVATGVHLRRSPRA